MSPNQASEHVVELKHTAVIQKIDAVYDLMLWMYHLPHSNLWDSFFFKDSSKSQRQNLQTPAHNMCTLKFNFLAETLILYAFWRKRPMYLYSSVHLETLSGRSTGVIIYEWAYFSESTF